MDDFDKILRDYPLHAMALGYFVLVTMPKPELQRLIAALGRMPGWNECLRYQHEKSQHEEFLRLQETNLREKKEEKDREKIRRFVWGEDKEISQATA